MFIYWMNNNLSFLYLVYFVARRSKGEQQVHIRSEAELNRPTPRTKTTLLLKTTITVV